MSNQRPNIKNLFDIDRADAIREELKAMGFAVEDSKEDAKLKKL